MSDNAALKLERGTKRTCQNPDCGERFYDLNRDPGRLPDLQQCVCDRAPASPASTRTICATTPKETSAHP